MKMSGSTCVQYSKMLSIPTDCLTVWSEFGDDSKQLKRRSMSLDDITDYTVPMASEKHQLEHSMSLTSNKFKGLRKKLCQKVSRSNTDLATQDTRCRKNGIDKYYFEGLSVDDDEASGCGAAIVTAQKLDKLCRKKEKTKEELIYQQWIRDGSVMEYLKSAQNAEISLGTSKTKSHFERSNQKTNTNIQLLQKKLEKYEQQMKEIEENGVPEGKGIIKVVQNSVRMGTSSIADAVAKPLGSFNNFRKKEKKAVNTMHCDDDCCSLNSTLTPSDDDYLSSSSPSSKRFRSDISENTRWMKVAREKSDSKMEALKNSIQNLEEEHDQGKKTIDLYTEQLARVLQKVQEEKEKNEQLEVRLSDLFNQWNDSTELYQNEMIGMKEEMDRTTEIVECVEYRFTGRTADIEDDVGNCITRLSKLEKQLVDYQPIRRLLDVDVKLLLYKTFGFVISLFIVVSFIVFSLVRLFLSSRVPLAVSGVTLTLLLVWIFSDDLSNIFISIWLGIVSKLW